MSVSLSPLPGFKTRFLTGGPSRVFLPILTEIVRVVQSRQIVCAGLSDGQVFNALCLAAREIEGATCLGIRRSYANEEAEKDPAWRAALDNVQRDFAGVGRLLKNNAKALEAGEPEVDFLFLDDLETGSQLRAELSSWQNKLTVNVVLAMHGLKRERDDLVAAEWKKLPGWKLEFAEGLGLGFSFLGDSAAKIREHFARDLPALAELNRQAAAEMALRLRAEQAEGAALAFTTREFWLDAVFEDREKAQVIMDHQLREIGRRDSVVRGQAEVARDLSRRLVSLVADRQRAQEIMDHQANEIRRLDAAVENLQSELRKWQAQIAQLKNLVAVARSACQRRGRCFDLYKQPKVHYTFPQKVTRELARTPRNLRRLMGQKAPRIAPAKPDSAPNQVARRIEVEPRYAAWIAQNEPGRDGLQTQRTTAKNWSVTISLLIPVYETPPSFLDELFQSICAQTNEKWEACVVDGGSTNRAVLETLARWSERDQRIRIERLPENLGIAENTNRALRMATGDYVALIDHDDLLPPFALYQFGAAMTAEEADIFYSDEDRLTIDGARARPFFKPAWSPELLLSSMYIGHLTAYRRDFIMRLGGFRPEFDFSQDYDLALRATEQTQRIVHIPHVCYHWREHPASGGSGGKPTARRSNLAALSDAVKRRAWDAEVLEYPTANRVRHRLPGAPRVSVIIPTDSPLRAEKCANELPSNTAYAATEFLIVTNSGLIEQLQQHPCDPRVRFVPFDALFNFSAKCNVGARASESEYLIFVNDDIETAQTDWIENVIEPLQNQEVGAVSPKLLYASGKIQHAGLVTGVRGLVGTALHQWPGESTEYHNFAQSMRPVSALSAACLAVRRSDFFRVGEYDEKRTPIAHSDFDLCFKIRETGLRCVYTPFATLTHRGHVSIGAVESPQREVDKSSIFLLQRWAHYTSHDPYFPEHMREWLYADSPTPLRMSSPPNSPRHDYDSDLLIVSHELSLTGAPIIISHLAAWLKEHGVFVVVMSPSDGPARRNLEENGVPLIIDPLLAAGFEAFARFGRGHAVQSHRTFLDFARDFDCVVGSTLFAAPIIRDLAKENIPHLWWIHEGLLGEQYLREYPVARSVLGDAGTIVTPDSHSRDLFQPWTRTTIRRLPHGLPDFAEGTTAKENGGRLKFLLLGSVEDRKGQQTFLDAINLLTPEVLAACEFFIVGRPHDARLTKIVRDAARGSASLHYREAVSHTEAVDLIRGIDVMVCASTDETGPLTLIEAMEFGKAILSTAVGCVGELLQPRGDGLFVGVGDAAGFARAMTKLATEPDLLQALGRKARRAYEEHFQINRFGEDFIKVMALAKNDFQAAHPVGRQRVTGT